MVARVVGSGRVGRNAIGECGPGVVKAETEIASLYESTKQEDDVLLTAGLPYEAPKAYCRPNVQRPVLGADFLRGPTSRVHSTGDSWLGLTSSSGAIVLAESAAVNALCALR